MCRVFFFGGGGEIAIYRSDLGSALLIITSMLMNYQLIQLFVQLFGGCRIKHQSCYLKIALCVSRTLLDLAMNVSMNE